MLLPHKISPIMAALFLVAGLVLCNNSSVEAKTKRGKRTTNPTAAKSRSISKSTRNYAGRGKRYYQEQTDEDLSLETTQAYAAVPDKIEVIENGFSNSTASNWMNLPKPASNLTATESPSPDRVKPVKMKIETSRVIQIQQALAKRNYYQGEISGRYDDATIDAMRRFQAQEGIPITGYPTAHALKRLGLAPQD